jgi:hypothetical protein
VVAAMRAALECNVAEALIEGPQDVFTLAERAGVHADALYRTLRALATVGIFQEVAPRIFANTPASEAMRAGHPSMARESLMFMTNQLHFQTCGEYMHSIRTGETCVDQCCDGVPIFKYFATHPIANEEFNDAMTAMSRRVVPAVLASYDFSTIGGTLCDVAGGHGMLLTSILQHHPEMNGILFDQEHVIAGARARIAQSGLDGRCAAVAGDFFEEVPAADSYIMKHIIHDWEESKAITILRNCAKAMRGHGKVLLVESVLPGPNAPHFGKWLDLLMMMMPGGKERTEEEYRELLGRAGLKLTRVIPNASPLSILEAEKA